MCFVLSKMQKLVKAAKEGTKDGLEKTKAAVKKGRSFIKTKSFCNGMVFFMSSVIFVSTEALIRYVLTLAQQKS